ncbi:hypothetical protein PR003_g26560 [Phytophthora rubi]|uniref:Amino acid transporter n=1 Tax=Phytophthora rubi TaxID=129364 RepID=A0A6A4C775_9STRA|nr:hypothetical protein PR003_g26560 [Phytophthora rubi]
MKISLPYGTSPTNGSPQGSTTPDMSLHEHSKRIGGRTLACYLITTCVAAAIGVAMAILFRSTFNSGEKGVTESAAPVALQCGEERGRSTNERYEGYRKAVALFLQRDINSTYQRADGALEDLTLTDAVQLQLDALVPSNITNSFAEGTLLSIVMFAVAFAPYWRVAMRVADCRRPRRSSTTCTTSLWSSSAGSSSSRQSQSARYWQQTARRKGQRKLD